MMGRYASWGLMILYESLAICHRNFHVVAERVQRFPAVVDDVLVVSNRDDGRGVATGGEVFERVSGVRLEGGNIEAMHTSDGVEIDAPAGLDEVVGRPEFTGTGLREYLDGVFE